MTCDPRTVSHQLSRNTSDNVWFHSSTPCYTQANNVVILLAWPQQDVDTRVARHLELEPAVTSAQCGTHITNFLRTAQLGCK